jgi:hypothetical protein
MGFCVLFVHQPKQLFPAVLQTSVIYFTVESNYFLFYPVYGGNSRVPLSVKGHSVVPNE